MKFRVLGRILVFGLILFIGFFIFTKAQHKTLLDKAL